MRKNNDINWITTFFRQKTSDKNLFCTPFIASDKETRQKPPPKTEN